MELTQIKVTIDREYDLFVNSHEFKTYQHDKEKQARFLKYPYTNIITLGGGRYKVVGHHDLNVDIDLFQAPSFVSKQAFNTWFANILSQHLYS
ncbi:hypothetical protein [Acinetobacter baumannii]|uniref:hypothetical protein n=1 Tax=Acinetobacter baumannii TaxID=470 RepID=UPI001AECB353|nr:hypothetical protein [Acinetobacter baumannii]MBP2983859.1 hypothetical protein [Acinetobacter baumannii]